MSPGTGVSTETRGSAPPVVPTLNPNDELLLQVRTDKWILDDAFSGYSTPLGTYLPLGDFVRMLDLAIAVARSSVNVPITSLVVESLLEEKRLGSTV